MPRQPDPQLEERILAAASKLWARGGEKGLTMRAVARAAGTTTPTVYERYRNRNDILRALRLETRNELFAAIRNTRDLDEMIERYLQFALEHRHAYEVLFDGVGKSPSLHEPWPTFNLMRDWLAKRLGGSPREQNRLMLAIWSLMHGAAMLIIRGHFEGALRIQTVRSCIDAIEAILACVAQNKHFAASGPAWPPHLILGEGRESRVDNHAAADDSGAKRKGKRRKARRPRRTIPG
ncbi:MAG TPA: TetR/AcrR family transcriptional regulator [Verrucomicrobiae bacterium]|nr:TetR/AcrR family transcriptional regulator [Verrucomicrobiae bacterium]